jgi:hypothetical protein
MEPRLGRMFHSSATGRRHTQTLPESLALRQALHPRDGCGTSITFAEYAADLAGDRTWWFWWDQPAL